MSFEFKNTSPDKSIPFVAKIRLQSYQGKGKFSKIVKIEQELASSLEVTKDLQKFKYKVGKYDHTTTTKYGFVEIFSDKSQANFKMMCGFPATYLPFMKYKMLSKV